MKNASRVLSAGIVLALVAAGCGPNAAKKTSPAQQPVRGHEAMAPITNTDECATRMHAICGSLLLYCRMHNALPPHIEDLKQVPSMDEIGEFVCPVSGQPYIYNPGGLPTADPGARVVIYDATAAHSGIRWGISINMQQGNARVIAVPESQFKNEPPPASQPARAK